MRVAPMWRVHGERLSKHQIGIIFIIRKHHFIIKYAFNNII
jgi:hypothetical protein